MKRWLISVVLAAAMTAPLPAGAGPESPAPPANGSPAPTEPAPVETSKAVTARPGMETIETVRPAVAPQPLPDADTTLPHDLSPWSMFLAADIVVKAVMLGLLVASLATWSVLFAKTIELGLARRRLRRAIARAVASSTLGDARVATAGENRGACPVVAALVGTAANEIEVSGHGMRDAGIQERCASRLAELVRADVHAMRRGMGLLATIGSTAPFVGLFGTVWGIMNSFIGISRSQTTNLAVVAPGIAEALLATAVGLVTAIPAVIIYNHFAQGLRRYGALTGEAKGAVERLLSRELDRREADAKNGPALRAAE